MVVGWSGAGKLSYFSGNFLSDTHQAEVGKIDRDVGDKIINIAFLVVFGRR